MATIDAAGVTQPPVITPLQALIAIPLILVLTVVFIALNSALGSAEYYVGFLFSLYWAGIQHADFKELPSTVVSAVLGLAMALVLQILTKRFGLSTGGLWFLTLVVPLLFLLITGMFKFFVNNATLLLLIAGTISHVQNHADFRGMFISLGVGVVFFGGVLWLVQALTARFQAKPAAAG